MATRAATAIAAALCVADLPLGLAADRSAVRSTGTRSSRRRQPAPPPEVQVLAVQEPGLNVVDYSFEEVVPLASDSVEVEVHACSFGSADVQQLEGQWGACLMPFVPGREAVGVVRSVGSSVKGLQQGQRVAVLLGSGLDSENDREGADRSALDFMTSGAAAHRLRLPATWAFALPAVLPSSQASGLLSCGGPIWSQLTRRKLPRGAKVAVVGGGAAGVLAMRMAAELGFETVFLKAESTSSADDASEKKRLPAGVHEELEATNTEDLRLHGGSVDALLCVTACELLDLSPLLPFLRRGGTVLLANTQSASLSLMPRLLQDRHVQLLCAEPLSHKEMLSMLHYCAQHRIRLQSQTTSEMTAENAAAALRSIAAQPESRAVLLRGAQHSRWLKANRTAARSAVAPGASSSAGSISSMFGVFSKVADESKKAATAMREGISKQANKLVEQVEREQMEEAAAKHGKLELPAGGGLNSQMADADDDAEDEDDELADDDEDVEDDESGDDEDEDEDEAEDGDDPDLERDDEDEVEDGDVAYEDEEEDEDEGEVEDEEDDVEDEEDEDEEDEDDEDDDELVEDDDEEEDTDDDEDQED